MFQDSSNIGFYNDNKFLRNDWSLLKDSWLRHWIKVQNSLSTEDLFLLWIADISACPRNSEMEFRGELSDVLNWREIYF
jgi:hypothetical protein